MSDSAGVHREVFCLTCLTRGRLLRAAGDKARVYNALVIGLGKYEDTFYGTPPLQPTTSICWECYKMLEKIAAFHQQVVTSHTILLSGEVFKSLSALRSFTNIGYNAEIYYEQLESFETIDVNLKSKTSPNINSDTVFHDIAVAAEGFHDKVDFKTELETIKVEPCDGDEDVGPSINDYDSDVPSAFTLASKYKKTQLNEEEMKKFRLLLSKREPFISSKYRCEMCIKSFSYKHVFEKHVTDTHTEIAGEHICNICSVRFKTKKMLNSHRINHYIQYSCTECDFQCNYINVMYTHHSHEHRDGNKYICKKCDHTFDMLQQLRSHQKKHRAKKLCTCDYCGKQMEKFNLVRHMLHHTGLPTFTCDTCGAVSRGEDAHRYHIKSRHNQQIVSENPDELYCVECDIHFKTSYNLRSHLKTTKRHAEHNMKVACRLCPSRFLTDSALNFHIKRHHIEKKCEICGLVLTSFYGWQTHMRRQHTPAEPEFTCHICNKTIKRKHRIEEHMRTHTGERPLVCPSCGDTFRQKSALYTHTKLKHRKRDPDTAVLT